MKIVISLLVLFLAAMLLRLYKKRKIVTPHKIKPTLATERPFSDDFLNKLVNTDYTKHLDSLKIHVQGHKAISSIVGNAGFILNLENNSWASAFRIDSTIFSEFGNGTIPQENLNKINSTKFGDETDFLNEDKPYSKDKNDINDEIKKCYGKTIEGLAIGDNTFNFAFKNGMELDFQLCNDKNNKPSIRVFWEQW